MVAILMKLIDVKITVFIFCLLCCTCFRCLKWWSKFPISPSYIIYKNKCKIQINFWREYLLIEWFVKDWIQKQDLRVETDSHKLVSYIKLRPRPVLLPKILTFSFFFSNPLLILKLLFRTVQKKKKWTFQSLLTIFLIFFCLLVFVLVYTSILLVFSATYRFIFHKTFDFWWKLVTDLQQLSLYDNR